MHTFARILWGLLAVYWLVSLVAFVFFGFEPSRFTIGTAMFTAIILFGTWAVEGRE